MDYLDWIFVFFGTLVALAGCWIQLHPERIIPGHSGPRQLPNKRLNPAELTQIRLLGASFVFMGSFFAVQMTIDLIHCTWWKGTIIGTVTASLAAMSVYARVRRQQRQPQLLVQQTPLRGKVLELR
jgi:hypothetical protein